MYDRSKLHVNPPPPIFFPSIAVFGFISKSFAKANLELHLFYNSPASLYLASRENSFLIWGLDSYIGFHSKLIKKAYM